MKNSKLQQFNPAEIDKEQLYFQALLMAFHTFLEEEKQRNAFTELRLMKAIEAARTLYR